MKQGAQDLLEVMHSHVHDPNPVSTLHLYNTRSRSYDSVGYADLSEIAFAFGARLMACGHGPGSVCMIACYSPFATLVAFYGAVSIGAVPMILPMPKALGSHEALIERIYFWGEKFSGRSALMLEQGLNEKFHQSIPPGVGVVRLLAEPAAHWDRLSKPARQWAPAASDVAFFQTTSSSTGDHKAVAISHGNIIANVHGIREAVGMGSSERMISWLPLFHDMGLVGAVLFSFCHGYPLWLMTPTQFVKRPSLWLKGMSEHRCSIATAPNFGYDYCSRLVSPDDVSALDLTAVKHLFIGAEPIRQSTVNSFIEKFSAAGISKEVIRPAYGLAESTIITTISRPDSSARFALLERDSIAVNQRVNVLSFTDIGGTPMNGMIVPDHVAVCTAGTPISDMDLKLVDEDGVPVAGELHVGEIVLSGNSVALGYVTGGAAEIEPFPDTGMRTGDLGVVIGEELYIIERIKNVIIRNGENFLVSALEQRIADLLDSSHEHVAVFESDIYDPASEIVVLVEKHGGLSTGQINPFLANLPRESYPIDRVLFSRARAIPRTTSGKKRHYMCRKMLREGGLDYQQLIEVDPQKLVTAMSARDTADGEDLTR
jgi:acyl-CoA synthetase (AMP-forming)/AMP-acid ligase II